MHMSVDQARHKGAAFGVQGHVGIGQGLAGASFDDQVIFNNGMGVGGDFTSDRVQEIGIDNLKGAHERGCHFLGGLF